MDINEALAVIRRFGDSFKCTGNVIPDVLKRTQFLGGDGLSYSNIHQIEHVDQDAIWEACLTQTYAYKIIVTSFMLVSLEKKYSWDKEEKTSHCTLIYVSNDYLDLHIYVAKWLLSNANPKFYKELSEHDRASRWGDDIQLINQQKVRR